LSVRLSGRKSYTQLLDPIQNEALTFCIGTFRTPSAESLQVEGNGQSLILRRSRLVVPHAIKLQSNPSNPAFDYIFNPQYRFVFQRKISAIPTFGLRIKNFHQDMDIDLDSVAPYRLPLNPTCTVQSPTVNFKLHTWKKATTESDKFKLQFYDLLNSYPDYTCIYTDGSKDGGRVSFAAVSGQSVINYHLPNNSSVFSAELQAILLALDFIESSDHDKFLIC
jgi:hypothetical protein